MSFQSSYCKKRSGRLARTRRRRQHYQPAVEALEDRSLLSVFMVTNADDGGPGSLRQAILDANAHHGIGGDKIEFAMPGPGVHTIQPVSALPAITDAVVINGYSQPGA